MRLHPLLSRLLAVLLAIGISFIAVTPAIAGEITGNYRQDTLTMVEDLNTLMSASEETAEIADLRSQIRQEINDYASRYRRDGRVSGLRSFTTMQTALNSVAGFYTSYGLSRPFPSKLKKRLTQEFRQVEIALKRGL